MLFADDMLAQQMQRVAKVKDTVTIEALLGERDNTRRKQKESIALEQQQMMRVLHQDGEA